MEVKNLQVKQFNEVQQNQIDNQVPVQKQGKFRRCANRSEKAKTKTGNNQKQTRMTSTIKQAWYSQEH